MGREPIPRYPSQAVRIGASCVAAFPRDKDGESVRRSVQRMCTPLRQDAQRLYQMGSGGCVTRPRRRVAAVDDDESVREALPDCLRQLGYEARAFASAAEFLASGCLPEIDCLILDIAMPGMSGPELQRELVRRGNIVPVIFITAQADSGMRAALRRQGAIEVLFKPYSKEELRLALEAAVARR